MKRNNPLKRMGRYFRSRKIGISRPMRGGWIRLGDERNLLSEEAILKMRETKQSDTPALVSDKKNGNKEN